MAYEVEGRILEVCNCNVLCPCWIGEDPDNGTCDAALAYHVDKGTVDGVDVSGRTFAVISHIPGNILQGNWKTAVIIDDEIDTGGSLMEAVDALVARGARSIYACATHGIFSPPAIERIEASPLDSVVVTDTMPIDPLTKPERVTVLTVADILAETIHNVFADDSVSAIFGDMNALF